MPAPIVGDPEPPPWLEGHALELWEEWAPAALAMGTLTSVDVERFAMGCAAAADYELARQRLRRGWTTSGQKHARVLAPEWSVLRDAEARFDRFCSRFGFDPSSRSTLKVTPPARSDPNSPWDV